MEIFYNNFIFYKIYNKFMFYKNILTIMCSNVDLQDNISTFIASWSIEKVIGHNIVTERKIIILYIHNTVAHSRFS